MDPRSIPESCRAPSLARRSFLKRLGFLAALPSLSLVGSRAASDCDRPTPRRLRLYQPSIETNSIYNPHPGLSPLLRYNHDVDIIRFKGRFFAAWNANNDPHEGAPGQFNYLSVSKDFRGWCLPVRMFTSEGNAKNPIESDNQWQPVFVNYRDEALFCAWNDFNTKKTFVSTTVDGKNWTNTEVPVGPDELASSVVGFPTTHGLLSKQNTIMFPCSLPFKGKLAVGTTQYAGILFSRDRGRSWEWSKPIEAVSWSEAGEDPARFGGEMIAIWEPTIWQNEDGSFGLLIRNSTAQDGATRAQRFEKSYRMILTATSKDGVLWSKARPIEVDTLCSRMLALSRVNSSTDLEMVMNDWPSAWPDRISSNRYFLSLFCSPVADPDLLLPGPVIQPTGGRAYYPNGFVDNGRMYLAYTYKPGIHSSVVYSLPDYSEPFLLPRGARTGLVIQDNIAILQQRHSTLGLVLTKKLTVQTAVNLSFAFNVRQYDGKAFTILTLGGKTRQGIELRMAYSERVKSDVLEIKVQDRVKILESARGMGEWNGINVTLGAASAHISVNGGKGETIDESILRKIAFGGLYVPPSWPVGVEPASDVQIDLDSIEVG